MVSPVKFIIIFTIFSLDCEHILEVLEYTVPGRFGQHARTIAAESTWEKMC